MATPETPAFRRGGRPPLDPLERRGSPLPVRFRAGELAAVEQRAAEANCPVATFIREQALKGRIVVRQYQTFADIDRHDLARIGSNLNQIARVLNQTGETTKARHIEAVLDELRALLARLEGIGGRPDELGER